MNTKSIFTALLLSIIFTITSSAGKSEKTTITGSVIDPNGEPVANAAIAIRGAQAHQTNTNTEGRFSTIITGRNSFIPKPYLQIRHIERNLAAVVELEKISTNLDITLTPGVIFSGRVIDANGVGIQDVEITLYFMVMEGGYEGGRPESIEIDPEGNFEIRAIPTDYEYSVGARAEGYGHRSAYFRSGDAIEGLVDYKSNPLVLEIANQSVSGIVVDIDGKPVAEARVSCHTYPQPNRTTKTDIEGKFTIEKICKGKITLNAEKSGMYGRVTIESSATDVKMVILEANTGIEPIIEPPPSLVGKSLPDFNNIKIDFSPEQTKSKKTIICFWDYEQRPSRNCMIQLNKKAQELKSKDVEIIAIHASKIEQEKLNEWTKENNISFPVGMIIENEEETHFNWGVKSLPWLILTDKNHVVTTEGFKFDELNNELKRN